MQVLLHEVYIHVYISSHYACYVCLPMFSYKALTTMSSTSTTQKQRNLILPAVALSCVLLHQCLQSNVATQQLAGAALLAARSVDSTIQLEDLTFVNNAAENDCAGALYIITGSDACSMLQNVTMTGNRAATSGGASVFDVRRGSSLFLYNVTAFENSALGGDGGAVQLLVQDDARAILAACSFSNNYATGNGGAVLLDANCSSLVTLEKPFMSYNRAEQSGGALYVSYGSKPGRALTGSAFGISPAAAGAVASPCTNMSDVKQRASLHLADLSYNVAGRQGGALYVAPASTLVILDATMSSNTACGTGGGSVGADNCSALVMQHSVLHNNRVMGSGGGFFAYGCRRLLLEYNNFTSNAAGVSGGGLAIEGLPDDAGGDAGMVGPSATGNLNGSIGVIGTALGFTSVIIHRAQVYGNAVSHTIDAQGVCASLTGSASASSQNQQWRKGMGGGLLITGKVVSALSRTNLAQPNEAFFGAALASTQRCRVAGPVPRGDAARLSNEVSVPTPDERESSSRLRRMYFSYQLQSIIGYIDESIGYSQYEKIQTGHCTSLASYVLMQNALDMRLCPPAAILVRFYSRSNLLHVWMIYMMRFAGGAMNVELTESSFSSSGVCRAS